MKGEIELPPAVAKSMRAAIMSATENYRRKKVHEESEKFRSFMVKRPWLHGGRRGLISNADYVSLKARDGCFWARLSPSEIAYFLGFVEGWTWRNR